MFPLLPSTLHAFPAAAERQGATADELHVRAAKNLPLLDLPEFQVIAQGEYSNRGSSPQTLEL